MKTMNGRPVITGADYPQTVERALHHSFQYWHNQRPDESWAWTKIAADALGAVQDSFSITGDTMYNPSGETTIYMGLGQLEEALVAYGCDKLDNPTPDGTEELIAVNGLLKNIDAVRPAA